MSNDNVNQVPSAWHKNRRREILQNHKEIKKLIGYDQRSLYAIILLIFLQYFFTYVASNLGYISIFFLAMTAGGCLKIWNFTLSHEICHKLVHPKLNGIWGDVLLMFMQNPAASYNYYVYYKYFHISHHTQLGLQSVEEVYKKSLKLEKADGDILIPYPVYTVRKKNDDQHLTGSYWFSNSIKRFFYFGFINPVAALLTISFVNLLYLLKPLYSIARILIAKRFMVKTSDISDIGLDIFIQRSISYFILLLIFLVLGWNSIFYIFLSDLFGLGFLFHPTALITRAGFHTSRIDGKACQPTISTYSGYLSILTGGLNHHVEHHDFPSIPGFKLYLLKKIAPEYYRNIPHFKGILAFYRDLIGEAGKNRVYGCQGTFSFPPNTKQKDI